MAGQILYVCARINASQTYMGPKLERRIHVQLCVDACHVETGNAHHDSNTCRWHVGEYGEEVNAISSLPALLESTALPGRAGALVSQSPH